MRKYLIIFGIALVACEQEQTVPDDLIARHNIIPLIVDIQIIEEHYHRLFAKPDLYIDALDSASQVIFEEHDVTKLQFNNSIDYYAENADTLFSIYEAALDTINFRINARSQQ